MAASDYITERNLNSLYGGHSPTLSTPATVWIALCSSAPTRTQTGTTIPELDESGYSRFEVTNNTTNWDAAALDGSDMVKKNAIVAEFGANTGETNWAAATHFAILDAASGGNLLDFGALSTSRTVQPGDVARFPVGSIKVYY